MYSRKLQLSLVFAWVGNKYKKSWFWYTLVLLHLVVIWYEQTCYKIQSDAKSDLNKDVPIYKLATLIWTNMSQITNFIWTEQTCSKQQNTSDLNKLGSTTLYTKFVHLYRLMINSQKQQQSIVLTYYLQNKASNRLIS